MTSASPSTSAGESREDRLALDGVTITDLFDYALRKLKKTEIVDNAIYRCRLCTRFDDCSVRGRKMLQSKAARLHYAAHMLTYQALLHFQSPEILCPICGTLIFTAGFGGPLIELELINHIEIQHAEVVLQELSPASLSLVQCNMIFGTNTVATVRMVSGEKLSGEKLERKNYAHCSLCSFDIFSRYKVPQAHHYYEWILEDHVTSHIGNIVDPSPAYSYTCNICSFENEPVAFTGGRDFLQHLFQYHRRKIDFACINNSTEFLWKAYNNLFIRIFGSIAPLVYRIVHGAKLNPFESPATELTAKNQASGPHKSVAKTKTPKPKTVFKPYVKPTIECGREECGNEVVNADDLDMVKHVILHVKHDEYRMRHHKEGTVPVWCCPKADKIFTVGGLLLHFVSDHFYDNEKVEMPLFHFVMTRCKDILRTIMKECVGDESVSPFKIIALLIDLDMEENSMPSWMQNFPQNTVNETFVELWSNVMCSRNLDAEDADLICFANPFSSSKPEGYKEVSNERSGSDVGSEDSEEDVIEKCDIVPMLEVIVRVRRFRYELRDHLPLKELLVPEPFPKRKRRINPKKSAPEGILVELREGREIDPFNLFPTADEAADQGEEDDVSPIANSKKESKWTPRPLYDDFSPSGEMLLTNTSQAGTNGITLGQLMPNQASKMKKSLRPFKGNLKYKAIPKPPLKRMSDGETTKKHDTALESFISDTVNSIMPEDARSIEQTPPIKTLHELLMEQIERPRKIEEQPVKRKRGRPPKLKAVG
ncbi:hypothetical protein L596_007573 [Steinernema carpocapsae]|uniref:Uncharacterized protein n=1 Tax=Steinernema carpocapsae TaxID=34508 RepID=A0A4U5PAD0_STECR|nr:hypothetical protein L596_007573 [Steinernema carpocapsae]